MEYIVFSLLVFVSTACVMGAFSQCYHGTVLQKTGMALVSIWSAWEASFIWMTGYSPPEISLAAFGMTLFAAGTMIKTWAWNKYRRRHDKRHTDTPTPAKKPVGVP